MTETSTMVSIPLINKPDTVIWDDGQGSNLQTASKAALRKKAKSRNRLGTIDSVDEKYLRGNSSPEGLEKP